MSTRVSARRSPLPRSAVEPEVLAAAGRLLAAGDRFAALSVGRICAEAGCSRSAFYVNFVDKADLLGRLVDGVAADIEVVAGRWLASRPLLDRAALVDALELALSTFRKHAPVLRAYAELAVHDDEVAHRWDARIDALANALALRLQEGRVAGVVRDDVAVGTAARLVVLGAERLLRDRVTSHPARDDRAFSVELGGLLWAMIGTADSN